MRFNPLDYPIAFANPERLATSHWTEHVPFGMALIHILRPHTLVELGTYAGVSYCGFCQAVKSLGADTRCYAVDTWQGDPHAGMYGSEVYEGLRDHHDPRYGEFSRLMKMTFDQALPYFADGSVDLLHIDGYHTYEAVRHDFDSWLPKMSARGVVILHDVNERDRQFGVWRLWSEIAARYPTFELLHEHGLGVAAVGNETPERLRPLLDAAASDRVHIREYFHLVGQRHRLLIELGELRAASSAHLAEKDSLIRQKDEALRAKDQELGAKDEAIRTLTETLARQHAAVAGLDKALRAKDEALRAKDEAIRTLTETLARQHAAVAGLDKALVVAAERELENRELSGQMAQMHREKERFEADLLALRQSEDRLRNAYEALAGTRVVRFAQRYWWPFTRLVRRNRRAGAEDPGAPAELVSALRSPLPETLYVGKGVAYPIRGWCYSQRAALRSLAVTINGRAQPVMLHSHAQLDVFTGQTPSVDRSGNSLLSGYFAVVNFAEVSEPATAALGLRAELADGTLLEQPLGEITLLPGYGASPLEAQFRDDSQLRVAICMTTFRPPPELFRRQVESIRAQTFENWVCVISDDASPQESQEQIRETIAGDPRFIYVAHSDRLGFYHNVERCLKYVPVDADFVALSDQDDQWDPDKLATLLAAFDAQTQLAYSDMRIVDPDGAVLSETFWAHRRNNHSNLPALMFANTITGAASIFRASLLPVLLPFPERVIDAYHDHWIGLSALVRGRLNFVARPLYSYCQHGGNVIGYKVESPSYGMLGVAKALLRASRNQMKLQSEARAHLGQASEEYPKIVHKVVLAETLLMRQPGAAPQKVRALKSIAALRRPIRPLAMQSLRAAVGRRPSLRMEQHHLRIAVGTRLWNAYFRSQKRRLLTTQQQIAQTASAAPQNDDREPAGRSLLPKAIRYGNTDWIAHNIAPLTLNVSARNPRRVNMLLATIDFRYVFGGYIAMFNLILRLHKAGYRTRIILLERTVFDREAWRTEIRRFADLESLFDDVEVIYRYDRSLPVDVSPADEFIATSCWSAHVAHAAMQQLNARPFTFLVQDYEPVFVPMNSVHALFEQAYTFPQFDLFSTSFLRDYFRINRIGVYRESAAQGDQRSVSFDNAINKSQVDRAALERPARRLLFYARPEPHAARNMFELGMLALVDLIRGEGFDLSRWSFHGIGSIDLSLRLELGPNHELHLVPRTTIREYVELLPTFDVGLSLMLTPHPSLVPLEMAAAGMLTVTNSYANKTSESLGAISSNLIVAEPTIGGIREGLLRAINAADDLDARVRGADVRWPGSWDEALSDGIIDRLKHFLN